MASALTFPSTDGRDQNVDCHPQTGGADITAAIQVYIPGQLHWVAARYTL